MDLTKDAIALIQETAVAAEDVQEVDRESRRAVFLHRGQEIVVALNAKPRTHTASSLADIIALANRFAESRADNGIPVVWYDFDKVVCVIDDAGHRVDTVTLPLVVSDVFARVMKLKGQVFTDKDFIRLLRIDLAGTLPPVILLDPVRKLKWESSTAVAANTTRMKESMDRSTKHEVSIEAEVPEEVTLNVAVWKTAGLRDKYSLNCTVDVDPAAQRFALIPFPDEIERVQQAALADVATTLGEGLSKDIPYYFGQP